LDFWWRTFLGQKFVGVRVRCMILWSMINGHTTTIFIENSMNDHFQ
jgi:hypothetical protein